MNDDLQKEYNLALENVKLLLETASMLAEVTQKNTGKSVFNVGDGAAIRLAVNNLKDKLEDCNAKA